MIIRHNRLLWINLGLIISFSVCYMEWGYDQASTVLETEYYVLFQKEFSRDTLTHPVILLGLLGQILILISAFRFNKMVNIAGGVMLGLIVLLVLMAGILGRKLLMVASVIPFVFLCTALIVQIRKQ